MLQKKKNARLFRSEIVRRINYCNLAPYLLAVFTKILNEPSLFRIELKKKRAKKGGRWTVKGEGGGEKGKREKEGKGKGIKLENGLRKKKKKMVTKGKE